MCWRYFRTQNEKKQYYAIFDQEILYPIKVRGRRRPKSLPNPWDDIPRADWRYRNWKHYRKHQWK